MTEAVRTHAEVIAMPAPSQPLPPLVACLEASEEVADLLATYLRRRGFAVVTYITAAHVPPVPVHTFLTKLQPAVCLYTLAPPYRENWQTLQTLRAARPELPFVLTTTNTQALRQAVGARACAPHELFGKPFDLEQIVAALRRALAGRPAILDGDLPQP
jgi:DNA-binding NtrC family response regulator